MNVCVRACNVSARERVNCEVRGKKEMGESGEWHILRSYSSSSHRSGMLDWDPVCITTFISEMLSSLGCSSPQLIQLFFPAR